MKSLTKIRVLDFALTCLLVQILLAETLFQSEFGKSQDVSGEPEATSQTVTAARPLDTTKMEAMADIYNSCLNV